MRGKDTEVCWHEG